ncbi:MAG: hypothetical protein MUC95_02315 [Spirochaetes bacterium]|jgi:hypothetical protein|nr:hypothetical protein [Spirochaetota bacterium]
MKDRICVIISYFNILYFFEIINIILLLLVTYGKTFSITVGFVLTVLLSIHIIRFYFNKGSSRKIQLYMMDLHIAYSLPFLIFIMITGINSSLPDYLFISIRLIITSAEAVFIYVLTDENFAGNYIDK